MAFLVATTSLPEVYRPNGSARTTTAGTPHARAKMYPFDPVVRLAIFMLYLVCWCECCNNEYKSMM